MKAISPHGIFDMHIGRILLIFALGSIAQAQSRDAQFAALSGRFFDEVVFHFDPAQGTAQGFHQFDTQLDNGSRAEIEQQTAALHKWEAQVRGFDPAGLSPFVAADRELMLAQIQSQLLSL
jgi:uncharacterized protein (DUF885 family)